MNHSIVRDTPNITCQLMLSRQMPSHIDVVSHSPQARLRPLLLNHVTPPVSSHLSKSSESSEVRPTSSCPSTSRYKLFECTQSLHSSFRISLLSVPCSSAKQWRNAFHNAPLRPLPHSPPPCHTRFPIPLLLPSDQRLRLPARHAHTLKMLAGRRL